MIDEQILRQFQEIGRDLYVADLVSSHGGNISIRLGDRLIIKRRGAMLGRLREEDLIETGLEKTDSAVMLASTELIVHRAIYLATRALAVVHAHPRTAIALSLSREEIVPIDNEASYLLHKVPVVAAEFASGSPELVEKVPAALQQYKIVDAARPRLLLRRPDAGRGVPMGLLPGGSVPDHHGSEDNRRTVHRVPEDERGLQELVVLTPDARRER